MYQALYRKWRPRTFDDVSGQSHITETLKNQVATGRLSHAYLFIGTRGTGKTTCAKILAKAVNCENPVNGNPCNRCKSCLGIDSGAVMDVVEMDAASNNGVDNVRALRDEAVFSPASVRKRVYIVDEVHMLSASAFNALLKILEEPPEHLMFILATTELHKVPATILSRCQRHSFKRLDSATIAERIRFVAGEEGIALEPAAAELLGKLADGAMRDGLSLLDQCAGSEIITDERVLAAMGLAGGHRTAALFETVCTGDTVRALQLFDELWRDGKAPQTVLNEISALQRDLLIMKIAPKGGRELLSGTYTEAVLRELAPKCSAELLTGGLESVQKALFSIRESASPRTAAELCLIGLCEPELGDGVSALRSRVARLEKALESGAVSVRAEEKRPAPVKEECPAPAPVRAVYEEKPVSVPAPAPWEDAVPEPEEERAPLPEEPPMPEERPAAPASAPSVPAGDVWAKMLTVLERTMDRGAYTLASDSFHVEAELTDKAFVVRAKNVFAMGMMSSQANQDKIREALVSVTGQGLPIRVEEAKAHQEDGASKLDALSRFSNVSFK